MGVQSLYWGSAALPGVGDQNARFLSAQLQPGVAKKFTLVFDAPEDDSSFELHIPVGTFSLSPDSDIALPD